jgi:hypothetical protein
MNIQSPNGSTPLTPFPESATASTRCSAVGASPATTGTRRRVHAVAGPGTSQPPSVKRNSTASA